MANFITDLLGGFGDGSSSEGIISVIKSSIFDTEEGDAGDFWEIAGLTLSVTQMILYLYLMNKYKDKLEEYSEKLESWANQNENVYKYFRDLDPEFYDYYKTLPEYEICHPAVERSRGQAWRQWGQTLRATKRTVRGYTPLKMVHVNTMFIDKAGILSSVSARRANTYMVERNRQDAKLIEKWEAIVASPVNVESYGAGAMKTVISESFKSMSGFGQGFNSAGSAFGTQLYKVLD